MSNQQKKTATEPGSARIIVWPLMAVAVVVALVLLGRLVQKAGGANSPAVEKRLTSLELVGMTRTTASNNSEDSPNCRNNSEDNSEDSPNCRTTARTAQIEN